MKLLDFEIEGNWRYTLKNLFDSQAVVELD